MYVFNVFTCFYIIKKYTLVSSQDTSCNNYLEYPGYRD